MSIDRKKFLKIVGIGAAGLTLRPPKDVFAGIKKSKISSKAHSRWAMVIDLAKCDQETGCTKCTEACHLDHNVPDFDNPKDELKWIWKEEFHNVFHGQGNKLLEDIQKKEHLHGHSGHGPALVLCNHCEEPACTKVCPTGSTWKRDDGIVMMDWHRCIGCRYCMVGCPYGARSFNWRDPRPKIEQLNNNFPTRMIGVVEKCTFCEEKDLTGGELPSCVEACPVDALVFGDLEDPDSKIRELLKNNFTIRRKPELGTQPQIYYIV